MFSLILLFVALVLFVLAAIPVPARTGLLAWGLAALTLGGFILPRFGY